MPYFKEQRFEKAADCTLNSTHTLQLPTTGLLDTISMQFGAVNTSVVYQDQPSTIHYHAKTIQVIGNTDKILFSLSGEEAIAKAFRKMRGLPPMTQHGYGAKTQWQTIPIFFGRWPHDGKYALDLSQWDKVELKVTNDMSSTYFTSLSQETRLHTIEDSTQAYSKFLKQWEYQSDKAASDGQYIRPKLPTKGLLRSLMIQLDPELTASTGAVVGDPIGDSYNWKLWFKDRALTVLDHRPKDLMRDEHFSRQLGVGVGSMFGYPSTSQYMDFLWAYIEGLAQTAVTTGAADTTQNGFDDSQARFQVLNFAGSAPFYHVVSRGYGLFHTFEVPFYQADDESEYLNLDFYKPIEIEWYSYKDDNTHRIILEQPLGQGPAGYA